MKHIVKKDSVKFKLKDKNNEQEKELLLRKKNTGGLRKRKTNRC